MNGKFRGGQLMKSTTVTSCKLTSRVVASCPLPAARCKLYSHSLDNHYLTLTNAKPICEPLCWECQQPSANDSSALSTPRQASAPGYTCCAVMPRSCASINLLHKLTRPLADGRHINDIVGHARHERCM